MQSTVGPSLGSLFWTASLSHAERCALHVDRRAISYGDLREQVARIAAVLMTESSRPPRLGAVFASRSTTAYAGILATLVAGRGYVPLNPKFPLQRSLHMLAVSGATTLIVGAECLDQLDALIAGMDRPLLVILPFTNANAIDQLRANHPNHRFVGEPEVAAARPLTAPTAVDPDAIAYLLFTSGSTGVPKGVMVSHANVLAFLEVIWQRYAITSDDRFSQTFDLTFDLSVFDMFACWGRGASLHCIPSAALMIPDDFIRDQALTIWFSVPAVGMMLAKLRRLTSNAFPTLRWSLFCGERLPRDVAAAWQLAAPHAIVENLYGPTEATIACTLYRWHDGSTDACVDGVVPIGVPFPAMTTAVVDDQLDEVGDGVRGELCLKGPQLSHGYWQDEAKTSEKFVAMAWYGGPDNRWYRTGDLAYVDVRGDLIHCGRTDDQIKLKGFRIELAEIEHVIRVAAQTSFVLVLPFPETAFGPSGLTAVLAHSAADEAELERATRAVLPDYMVPGTFVFVDELPRNANGKLDRAAVMAALRSGELG